MPWRHLHLVRALSAAGLVGSLMFLGGAVATARPVDELEPTTPPPDSATETVDLLKASRSGELEVEATGQGQDQVRLTIRNTSGKRLGVIIPPGLVAANTTGQGRGFQSMGLGAITNRPGGFGQFQPPAGAAGFQSIPINGVVEQPSLAIPADETLEVSIPAVCLDFGVNPPSPGDGFTLMDVNEFTDDVRAQTALRGLALWGTSQGVAQAVMWRVRDDVSFERMAASDGKVVNAHEAALAARFVDAVDATAVDQPIDPSLLTEGRVHVQVVDGDRSAQSEVQRLNEGLAGLHLLGLPIQVAEGPEPPSAQAPAIFVKVAVAETSAGTTRGRIVVSYCSSDDRWRPLGKTAFEERSTIAVFDSQDLARVLDAELARAFVAVKTVKRSATSTTLRVENRLPFSLAGVRVRAGDSPGSPVVPFAAVGVGPARSIMLPIQADQARIESVELNGL